MSDQTNISAPEPNQQAGSDRKAGMNAVRARQGVKGHNVRYVLIVSLIGVLAGLAAAYFVFFPSA